MTVARLAPASTRLRDPGINANNCRAIGTVRAAWSGRTKKAKPAPSVERAVGFRSVVEAGPALLRERYSTGGTGGTASIQVELPGRQSSALRSAVPGDVHARSATSTPGLGRALRSPVCIKPRSARESSLPNARTQIRTSV